MHLVIVTKEVIFGLRVKDQFTLLLNFIRNANYI